MHRPGLRPGHLLRARSAGNNGVQQSLLELGIPTYDGWGPRYKAFRDPEKRGRFWSRGDSYLLGVLERAEYNYKLYIKRCRGQGEEAVRLNLAIGHVRHLFARRGLRLAP